MSCSPTAGKPRWRRWGAWFVCTLILAYLLLLIPEPAPPPLPGAGQQAFIWNRDAFWLGLETRLQTARTWDAAQRNAQFDQALEQFRRVLDQVAATNLPLDAPAFDQLETNLFELAPRAAVSPERLPEFLAATIRLNQLAKQQSEHWPPDAAARQRLYRLLYGNRAAVEEVLLQLPKATNALLVYPGNAVPAVPHAEVMGVVLCSGDILVSRGGAATSALIARGNDYRGNFSHVALVHVDEITRRVSVIEAHIESGVLVRPIEAYLAETKLRILVLRLRDDLPSLQTDSQLPHKVAAFSISNSFARHIPYDFAMNYTDPTQQFCSEVVSTAYRAADVSLWAFRSHISTPGVTRWLATMGVRYFETEEPSDLEYDPQLSLVAEWRDPETLFRDHVDSAVVDAMLEAAERGAALNYPYWKLPLARILKTGSVLWNWFGGVGPVPEGMSATTALRVEQLNADHAAAREQVLIAAARFRAEHGYAPPCWELLRFAREALQP